MQFFFGIADKLHFQLPAGKRYFRKRHFSSPKSTHMTEFYFENFNLMDGIIKAGFDGDGSPRSIFPSMIGRSKYKNSRNFPSAFSNGARKREFRGEVSNLVQETCKYHKILSRFQRFGELAQFDRIIILKRL